MLMHLMMDSASLPRPFRPDSAVRMRLTFDAGPLATEVAALGTQAWQTHFNADYHDGDWSGLPMLTANGNGDSLVVPRAETQSTNVAQAMQPTSYATRCPQLVTAIRSLHCPIKSARLLRLAPGAVIRKHADHDLVWGDGEARLHIPVLTHDRVEFYVDGARVVMQPGECWHLDLSKPHRVQNLGASECIHLVVACGVNEWLEQHVRAGWTPFTTQQTAPAQDSGQQFARFRDLVFANVQLQRDLRAAKTLDELSATAVAAGAASGLHFSLEDVRAHCNQAHRDWIEQWIM